MIYQLNYLTERIKAVSWTRSVGRRYREAEFLFVVAMLAWLSVTLR